MGKDRTYDDAEIAERLKTLEPWRYVDGALQRTFKTANWKSTLMVVTTIGHLCEAAWHHPDLVVSYNKVVVRLSTHSEKGITDKDFAMARKIEDVVAWQPAREESALDGTPDDPRYAYIKYD